MRQRGSQVCVVGNAAFDLLLQTERLPRAGETLLARHTQLDFGGKGANQAVCAARAGAAVLLFCALGDDADGGRFLSRLVDEGIDTQHIRRLPCATDLSVITVDLQGENTIVTRNQAAAQYRPDPQAVLDATAAGDWVVLQGNLDAGLSTDILRLARSQQRRTLLNPAPVPAACLQMLGYVDVLVLNQVEAAAITQRDGPAEAARRLQQAGAQHVVVTLGAAGLLWCNARGIQQLPAVPAQAVDTVGAGDVFCGTLVAGLAQGYAMASALQWAQAAAALSVTRHGTQASFPTHPEMRSLQPETS